MQITLNEEEIKDAIVGYVSTQIKIEANQRIDVELKAGRGDSGHTATLDIRAATINSNMGNSKPVTRSTIDQVASHIQARVSEDQAQADEEAATPVAAEPVSKPRGLKLANLKAVHKETTQPTPVEEVEGVADISADGLTTSEDVALSDDVVATSRDDEPPMNEVEAEEPLEVVVTKPTPVLKTRSIFNVSSK